MSILENMKRRKDELEEELSMLRMSLAETQDMGDINQLNIEIERVKADLAEAKNDIKERMEEVSE